MTGFPRVGSPLAAAIAAAMAASCLPQNPPAPSPPPDSGVPPKAAPAAVKPGSISSIALSDFLPLQQSGGAVIVDVRPGFFHSLGHIPGSVNWPKNGFDAGRATHEPAVRAAADAKRPVILYCTDRNCPDSLAVAKRLAALGYSVSILEGGYADWRAADLPVE